MKRVRLPVVSLLGLLGAFAPAWQALAANAGQDPCENVENEPAIARDSSVSINTSSTQDLIAIPGIFTWESATASVSGQVNVNRSKYEDSECFLFFCHDVTRIRNNFATPNQYPLTIVSDIAATFSSASDTPVAGLPGDSDREGAANPRLQVVLRGAIAPGNGGIVRQDCSADPQVCSSDKYNVRIKIASGKRAKFLAKFLSEHRLSYSEIMTQSVLNENLRNSSPKVKGCVARGLLAQASAFHGPGTGESPAERQQILQEALSWSQDDDNIKSALAATYVETGQYGQARAASEGAIADIEKRISAETASAGDYDTISDSYANLAEVDWREVAGVSTNGVANGIAHLQMAIDRTDKRLNFYPFGEGADDARSRRAGYAMRLAGMLARQGSFESIRNAAKPLETALQLLPDAAPGIPLSADITRADIIALLPIERALSNRNWSEVRADVPVPSSFILSRFGANPTDTRNAAIAWDRSTGQINAIAGLSAHPNAALPLFKVEKGCVIEAVGFGKDDAIALVADEKCSGFTKWSFYTKAGKLGAVSFQGVPQLLAVSATKDGNTRLGAVVDGRVRTWLLDKDGKLSDLDPELKNYDAVRMGPNPYQVAVRKVKEWFLRTYDQNKKETIEPPQIISCSGKDQFLDDVALTTEGGVLAIGPGCGLFYWKSATDLTAAQTYTRTDYGSWPSGGRFRFGWVGQLDEPVVVFNESKRARQVLVFPPVALGTKAQNVDTYEVYISDVDAAYRSREIDDENHATSTDLDEFWNIRVEGVSFESRAIASDKSGRRMNWPRVQLSVRGVLGQLIGSDPSFAKRLQKSPLINGSDFKEFRRGKDYLWGLNHAQSAIVRFSDPIQILSIPKSVQARTLGFAPNEGAPDSVSVQLAVYSNAALDQIIWLTPNQSSPNCQMSGTSFQGGVCTAAELVEAWGEPAANLNIVSEQSGILTDRRKVYALALQTDDKTRIFPFPLQNSPPTTFPVGSDFGILGFSSAPGAAAATLFGLRGGKLVVLRDGQELPGVEEAKTVDLAKSRVVSSSGRLLVLASDWSGYRLLDATGAKVVEINCSDAGRHCPMSSGDFQNKLKALGSDLAWPYSGVLPTVTASSDLSALAFVSFGTEPQLQWSRIVLKSSLDLPDFAEEKVLVRPGIPLLYARAAGEDILSIQPARSLQEQWSLSGTGAPSQPRSQEPAAETETQGETVFFVFFAEGADEPLATSHTDMTSAAACLKNWQSAEIALTGFSSVAGTREDNLALSRRRAEFVSSQLTREGVAASRLVDHVKGEGERGASSDNSTFSRRVEIWAKGKLDKTARSMCEKGLQGTVSARATR